eukprot:175732-Amphidinium_carterae.1
MANAIVWRLFQQLKKWGCLVWAGTVSAEECDVAVVADELVDVSEECDVVVEAVVRLVTLLAVVAEVAVLLSTLSTTNKIEEYREPKT